MVRRKRKKWSAYAANSGKILYPARLRFLMIFSGIVFFLIIVRLFQLQVISGEYFQEKIQNQVSSSKEMSARRGDILARDPKTGDLVKLAMNTSLDELRIDAKEIPDKHLVADIITPLVFGEEEYKLCQSDPSFCPEGSVIFPEIQIDPETLKSTEPDPILPTFEIALEKRKQEILEKLNTDNRYILIKKRLSPEVSERISDLKYQYSLAHKKDKARIYAQRGDGDLAVPDYLKGVILESNPLRYYPEQELASQIIGFKNHEGQGQYGIEGKMNSILAGKKGLFFGRSDTRGRSIGLSVEDFQKAVDGSDVVLTIDRLIQKKVEEVLSASVQKYRADSGQVVVMDPKTGAILALANYPTFNPNEFGNVYLIRRTLPEDFKRIFRTTPLFQKNPDPDAEEKYIPAKYEDYTNAWQIGYDPEFYIYENLAGPGAYVNKAIQEVYEPGSVFKPIVMAIALNENEVRPSTQYFEEKPIEVDVGGRLVPIRNADKQYKGWQTMTNVLERSANLGMVFVAKKLGKGVMYENLKNFGFGTETYIELDEEQSGTLNYYTQWSTAALFNTAFGQGVSATPLQVVTAWCALANGGRLPQPHIVSEIQHADGTIDKTRPQYTAVLKADAAATITSMLVSAVNNRARPVTKIDGYKVAGKTGTSQIARTDGPGYEDTSKEGSTITSFAGYAPAEDPRFVILVKFDRPRYGSADNTWGENTAAPVFKELAQYLFEYFDIPPKL